MKPKSHTLFHFTRSLNSLKSILNAGFWPRYCMEDVSWQTPLPESTPFVAFPMVCFCDIPLSRIEEHVNFYGDFGIGMTRDWAVTNGLNPLMYMAGHNSVAKAVMNISDIANESRARKMVDVMTSLRHLAMHIKPAIGKMVVNGLPVQKDFYQESEWRYIAQQDNLDRFLKADKFADEISRAKANEATQKHAMLRFLPRDVRYLFVRSDAEIPALVNFIQTDLDQYPSADLKILVSRVTSLETLRADW